MEESLHVVNTFEHDMTCLDIFMDQTRIVLSIGVQSTSFTKHGNEGVHHAPEMACVHWQLHVAACPKA